MTANRRVWAVAASALVAGAALSLSAAESADGRTVTLTNAFGSVSVERRGARVVSYVPSGGAEALTVLPGGTGGWMLCWPWFGSLQPAPEASRHGFARDCDFAVVRRTETSKFAEVELRLVANETTRKRFPHDFALSVVVRLADELTVAMTATNTGSEPFDVTEAMHPYFRVGDPRRCRLAGAAVADVPLGKALDFPAKGTVVLSDAALGRELLLTPFGARDLRVWNPGEKGHLSKTATALGPDDWRSFVCVEPGALSAAARYSLAPGESHTLSLSCGVRLRF